MNDILNNSMREHPLRLIVVIDRYLPILGGAQKNTHEMCSWLVKNGYCHVTVLSRHLDKQLVPRDTIDGIFVLRFSYHPVRLISKLLFIFEAVCFLVSKRSEYDIVLVVPCALYVEYFSTFIASLIANIPYVLRTTSMMHFDVMFSWRLLSLKQYVQRIMVPPFWWRLIINRACAFVTQGSVLYEAALIHTIRNIYDIPHGVDTHKYKWACNYAKQRLRDRLLLPHDKVLFITVTRYVNGKNQEALIQAAELLSKSDLQGQYHVIILGATESNQITSNEAALKRYVTERRLWHCISFYNDVVNVEDYMRASDVFVFPSCLHEGLSRVLLEGLFCGLGIICSDIAQNKCAFPNEMGLFFSPKDIDALERHMRLMITDADLRASNGKRVAEFAHQTYALEIAARKYLSLFENCINKYV